MPVMIDGKHRLELGYFSVVKNHSSTLGFGCFSQYFRVVGKAYGAVTKCFVYARNSDVVAFVLVSRCNRFERHISAMA